jgi:hypothetical protein
VPLDVPQHTRLFGLSSQLPPSKVLHCCSSQRFLRLLPHLREAARFKLHRYLLRRLTFALSALPFQFGCYLLRRAFRFEEPSHLVPGCLFRRLSPPLFIFRRLSSDSLLKHFDLSVALPTTIFFSNAIRNGCVDTALICQMSLGVRQIRS